MLFVFFAQIQFILKVILERKKRIHVYYEMTRQNDDFIEMQKLLSLKHSLGIRKHAFFDACAKGTFIFPPIFENMVFFQTFCGNLPKLK